MKALTFKVRFETAQFKTHHLKLTRGTYLIPPPSAVAGSFGAILGIPRNRLKEYCTQYKLLAGAGLISLGGVYTTYSRIFKFHRNVDKIIELLKEWTSVKTSKVYKQVVELTPLKESEELFEPEYKFAIVAEDEVIEEGLRRINSLDFVYEIFGGNDYHFMHFVGEAKEARYIKSKEGIGYCPKDDFSQLAVENYRILAEPKYTTGSERERLPIVIFSPVGPKMEIFAFVYRANIITKVEKDAVQDREDTIFVYDPVRYLVP